MADGITRAELLRKGLLGMTALSVVPAASSCEGGETQRTQAAEPEETLPVGYREVEGFAPGFHTCRGIAAEGDTVWVAGDMAVRSFRNGESVESLDVPGAAQALATTPDGTIYAALDDRIVVVAKGQTVEWESLGPRARLVHLVVAGSDVLAADAGNRQVLRFDREGKLRNRIGSRNPGVGYPGLVVPSPYLGMALLPSGELLVCNPGQHRLETHTLDGQLQDAIGKAGQGIADFCGCCNPMSVAVLPNGDLVTAEKGIPRVKVLAPDGSLKTVVAPPQAFEVNTKGLEVVVQGTQVLVLDPWEGKVRVFVPA